MKEYFPIFDHHPDLVYLDSASSTQKPWCVLETKDWFLRTSYANVHRGLYELSEQAEEVYMSSKKVVADWIGAWSAHEIVSTHSSTYAANIIAQALSHNDDLTRGDVVILSVSEHHANIVPWLILKDRIGIENSLCSTQWWVSDWSGPSTVTFGWACESGLCSACQQCHLSHSSNWTDSRYHRYTKVFCAWSCPVSSTHFGRCW